jgi:hypothetical protein
MLSCYPRLVQYCVMSFSPYDIRILLRIVNQGNNGKKICFQMAARQRRGQNEQITPPPPPAPTMQELMA